MKKKFRRMKLRSVSLIVGLFVFSFFSVQGAEAVPIDFSTIAGSGNFVTFTGGPDTSALSSDTSITFGDSSIDNLGVFGTVTFSGALTIDQPVTDLLAVPLVQQSTLGGLLVLDVTIYTDSTLTVVDSTLSGTFSPVNIVQTGGIGGLNSSLTANLSGITTTGSHALITQFTGGGVVPISWTIDTGSTLEELAALGDGTTVDASYSGSISVPEPASLILLGSGLVGLGFFGWRKKTPEMV